MSLLPKPESRAWSPDAVRALRAAVGETLRAFAERLNVSPSTLHYWEQGSTVPSGATRALLDYVARDVERIQSVTGGQNHPGGGASV